MRAILDDASRRWVPVRGAVAWCASVLVLACGGRASCGPPTRLPAEPPCAADGGSSFSLPSSRHYRLASTGLQLTPRDGYRLSSANLATDVDVVALHQDFYGVPWDSFERNEDPPKEWVTLMERLGSEIAAAKKDVFLSLALVGGDGRTTLADKTVVTGGRVSAQANWTQRCYDFDKASDGQAKAEAYLRYAKWMVARFQPRYVNAAIEINQFQVCHDAWPAMVRVANRVYDALKSSQPDLLVFASIQLDVLEGYNADFNRAFCPDKTREQCAQESFEGVAPLKGDRFAVSTYPFMVGDILRVDRIPPDYFTRAATRANRRLLIAETGWNAASTAAQLGAQCWWPLTSCVDEQAAYLALLLDVVERNNVDLLTWWSNRDVLPQALTTSCPCDAGAEWCSVLDAWRSLGSDDSARFGMEVLLKVWGTMGVRDYEGRPRGQTWLLWSRALALPIDSR